MAGFLKQTLYLVFSFLISGLCASFNAEEVVAEVTLRETHGIDRNVEYVEFTIQIPIKKSFDANMNFVAESGKNNLQIPCQIIEHTIYEKQNIAQFRLILPVSVDAYQSDKFVIKSVMKNNFFKSDLSLSGKGFELIIENNYYRADLTKSNQSEAKSHESGQLRELFIKMGFDVLLHRTENRMHWAPNFQNQKVEYYKTIAGWEQPENYELVDGPFLIRTMRSDRAPEHQEILLTANYSFYADLPYFKFYSSMVFEKDVVMSLLRNDEMTMDSLFTHLAFLSNSGKIIDLSFKDRYEFLERNPIGNDAQWLCFYNEDKGYAFGSIRIKYDITNDRGFPSPTYHPHTKISDGAEGGKYWNRCLINENPVLVPTGSRYIEENAYIVFKINREKKFSEIELWANKIRNPLEIKTKQIM